jgi:hypothetical protein
MLTCTQLVSPVDAPVNIAMIPQTNGVVTSFWRFGAGATWIPCKYAVRAAYTVSSRLPGPSQNPARRTFKISPLARPESPDRPPSNGVASETTSISNFSRYTACVV